MEVSVASIHLGVIITGALVLYSIQVSLFIEHI